MRALSHLCVAIALLASAAGACADDKKPAELRMQSAAPPGTPWANGVQAMIKIVETESAGSLTIKAAPYGAEQDTILQLARGRIDMGAWSLNGVSQLVPELSLLQLPFFFSGTEEQDCVLDTALSGPVADLLAKKGLRFTGWNDAGVVHLIGKKAFPLPADVQGLKAGTQGTRAYAVFWSAAGTSPRALGSTDLSSAFQTGLIDVAANVTTVYVAAGIGKVAPVMTRVHLTPGPLLWLVNQQSWDKLTPQQQQALHKAQPPAAQIRASVRGFEGVLVERHKQAGGQIVEVTPEQRAQWRQLAAATWPQVVKDLGPDAEKFYAQMEAGRQACQKRT